MKDKLKPGMCRVEYSLVLHRGRGIKNERITLHCPPEVLTEGLRRYRRLSEAVLKESVEAMK